MMLLDILFFTAVFGGAVCIAMMVSVYTDHGDD